MWVFGYGSLMDDGWEAAFKCSQRRVATLQGFRRTFDKASTTNRGSKTHPCPTLNLERDQTGMCEGIAFEFPADLEVAVREYLAKREGKDFDVEELTVRLADGPEVLALVPIYHGKNRTAGTSKEKAAMATKAVGEKGSCTDYVRDVAESLSKLNLHDPAVSDYW